MTEYASVSPPAGNASMRLPRNLGLHYDYGFEIVGDEKVTEVRVGEREEMLD